MPALRLAASIGGRAIASVALPLKTWASLTAPWPASVLLAPVLVTGRMGFADFGLRVLALDASRTFGPAPVAAPLGPPPFGSGSNGRLSWRRL